MGDESERGKDGDRVANSQPAQQGVEQRAGGQVRRHIDGELRERRWADGRDGEPPRQHSQSDTGTPAAKAPPWMRIE